MEKTAQTGDRLIKTLRIPSCPGQIAVQNDGRYGRNNVCYIPGMGSFHRLRAFYSDIPCGDDTWGVPRVLEICQTCPLCWDACPTGCIDAIRFLIHADQCLTHFNESENPLPNRIKPEWYKALLGCLKCQQVCPLNKGVLMQIQDTSESFTRAETE